MNKNNPFPIPLSIHNLVLVLCTLLVMRCNLSNGPNSQTLEDSGKSRLPARVIVASEAVNSKVLFSNDFSDPKRLGFSVFAGRTSIENRLNITTGSSLALLINEDVLMPYDSGLDIAIPIGQIPSVAFVYRTATSFRNIPSDVYDRREVDPEQALLYWIFQYSDAKNYRFIRIDKEVFRDPATEISAYDRMVVYCTLGEVVNGDFSLDLNSRTECHTRQASMGANGKLDFNWESPVRVAARVTGRNVNVYQVRENRLVLAKSYLYPSFAAGKRFGILAQGYYRSTAIDQITVLTGAGFEERFGTVAPCPQGGVGLDGKCWYVTSYWGPEQRELCKNRGLQFDMAGARVPIPENARNFFGTVVDVPFCVRVVPQIYPQAGTIIGAAFGGNEGYECLTCVDGICSQNRYLVPTSCSAPRSSLAYPR